MSDLLSKVTASGLSAGVFLLWWPAHVTSQGGDALLVRGLLWALAFEILLLAFRPLERAVEAAIRTRRAGAIAPRRIGPAFALAAAGAVAPVAMLFGSHAPIAAPARAAAPKVIVKREIVRRMVVVRHVNRIIRVAPAATTAAPAPATQPAAVVPAKTPAPVKTTVAKKAATTPAATTATSPPAATTAKPSITATTTQPTTTTAPAAAAAATRAAPAAKTAAG